MILNEVVGNIKAQLNTWQSEGLNEAQTSQVIVLPLLKALDYDIWNPFEVCPQEVSNGNIPDYIVTSNNERRFIVEVKKLNTSFNNTMKTQAVSYANNHAIRWAILSDGNQWLLFDSFLVNKPAHERLVLELAFENLEASLMASYLNQLLNARNWKLENNKVELIAKNITNHIDLNNKLQPLADQLLKLMNEYTIQSLDAALKLEKRLQVWTEQQRDLVLSNLAIIVKLTKSTVDSGGNLKQEQSFNVKTNLTQALRQGIKQTAPLKRVSQLSSFEAYVQGKEVAANSWRDIHAGIAEAFIILSRENELDKNDALYKSLTERKKKRWNWLFTKCL